MSELIHCHLAMLCLFPVVTSFHHLKPPERDLTLLSHMKSIKSLRQAGLTAVFTGQTVSKFGIKQSVLIKLE